MAGTASDKIWYEDVRVLYQRWKEFFPVPEHTPEERINALVRLTLYSTAATYVYNRQARTIVLGLGVAAVISFVFGSRSREGFPDGVPGGPGGAGGAGAGAAAACTQPTRDNPFANALLTDLGKPARAPACAYDTVRDAVKTNFNDGLFRNATDIYEKENSQHQFYTMPVNNGIPDTGAFANFLYGGMKSCKEKQEHCPPRM